jgi:hypothetical protein
MTFLLSEDDALRKHLQGIVVHDQKADGESVPRQVGVWFGQPDQELRDQRYPYITIDMIDVNREPDREMRGMVRSDDPNAQYLAPTEEENPDENNWEIELPIPVGIDYQITAYSRHPRHDREIAAQMMFKKLPLRFGELHLDDNTTRRLEVLDYSKRDITEQAKRLFIIAVTVRVVSEVKQGVYHLLNTVQEVNITELSQINVR